MSRSQKCQRTRTVYKQDRCVRDISPNGAQSEAGVWRYHSNQSPTTVLHDIFQQLNTLGNTPSDTYNQTGTHQSVPCTAYCFLGVLKINKPRRWGRARDLASQTGRGPQSEVKPLRLVHTGRTKVQFLTISNCTPYV